MQIVEIITNQNLLLKGGHNNPSTQTHALSATITINSQAKGNHRVCVGCPPAKTLTSSLFKTQSS